MKKVAAFLFAAIAFTACGGNQRILNSAESSTTPAVNDAAPQLSGFELELNAMRTADFNFIYVFRRKDGLPLDSTDKKFAADNIPVEMNRRKVIDDGKAIIIGSNYRLPPENSQVLVELFAAENYSKPENEIIDGNAGR